MVEGHEWMAQERLPGDNLAAVWEHLGSAERASAVADLWHRLTFLRLTDTTGLVLPATPLYALEPDLIARQLARASPIVGDLVARRAETMVEVGLAATTTVSTSLVHTDLVFTNVVWTGSAAIPIDFEFACRGPLDLDVDCIGRDVVSRGDQAAIASLRRVLEPTLDTPGADERLRGYTVLRDLWAIGKWIDRDPTLAGARSWQPVRELINDTRRTGWLDQLLARPAATSPGPTG
jgi:hypothetical protein